MAIGKYEGETWGGLVSFYHQGPRVQVKVGLMLKINGIPSGVWTSPAAPYVGPDLGSQGYEIQLQGLFTTQGLLGVGSTVDVLKAIQQIDKPFYASGQDMILADWDRDVYKYLGQSPQTVTFTIQASNLPDDSLMWMLSWTDSVQRSYTSAWAYLTNKITFSNVGNVGTMTVRVQRSGLSDYVKLNMGPWQFPNGASRILDVQNGVLL